MQNTKAFEVLRLSAATICIRIAYEERKEREPMLQKEEVSSNLPQPRMHPGGG
jgi:hypothetical protein